MTNVLLDGFSNYWHRRKSSMKNHTRGETTSVARLSQLRSVPSLWSGIGEQSRSISRGLKINKNSAEGEVFLVDVPSYRTFQALRNKFRKARDSGPIPRGSDSSQCELSVLLVERSAPCL